VRAKNWFCRSSRAASAKEAAAEPNLSEGRATALPKNFGKPEACPPKESKNQRIGRCIPKRDFYKADKVALMKPITQTST